MRRTDQSRAAGAIPPTNEEGPPVAAGSAPQESKRNESPDSRAVPLAGQALRVIEGEGKAEQYLARLKAEQAGPDELALIVSMLYGATLRGFCRVIEKAIGRSHA